MSRPRFPHLAQARREEAAARLQQARQREERRQAAGKQRTSRDGAETRAGAPLPPRERVTGAPHRVAATPLPPRGRQPSVRRTAAPLPPRERPARALHPAAVPMAPRPAAPSPRSSSASSASSSRKLHKPSSPRAVQRPLPPFPERSAQRATPDARAAAPRPVEARSSTRPPLPEPGRTGSSGRTVARERPASAPPQRRAQPAERPKSKLQRRPAPYRVSFPSAAPAATSSSLPPRPATRLALALRSDSRNAAAATPARATRPALLPSTATPTDWLGVRGGALCRPDGQRVQLRGVQLPLQLHGAAAATADAAALQDARTLLAEVPPGQRCVAVCVHLVAQLQPAALAALDRHIAQLASAGTYTLLRIEARLWMHGHHLRLARRYAGHSGVMFGLMGRSALSARLAAALQDVHAVHPRALGWLPLASAATALQRGFDQGLGLLWDAERPQAPHASLLAAALGHPVLLDGWQPQVLSALAQERLITLCAQGGMGWLARANEPWLARERGQPVLSRSARCVQRAVYLSSAFQSGVQGLRPTRSPHPLAF